MHVASWARSPGLGPPLLEDSSFDNTSEYYGNIEIYSLEVSNYYAGIPIRLH